MSNDRYTEGVYNRLKAMPSNATAADVERIIGNDSWVSIYCDECGNKVPVVIEIGDAPDYGSSTANVCLTCLEEAIRLGSLGDAVLEMDNAPHNIYADWLEERGCQNLAKRIRKKQE